MTDLDALVTGGPAVARGARPRPTSAWSRRCSAAADWYAGPGDDGAVLPTATGRVVVGGEAILPAFVARRPVRRRHRGGAGQRQRPGRHGRPARWRCSTPWSAARTSPARCCAGCAGRRGRTTCRSSAATSPRTDGPPALSAFGVGSAPTGCCRRRTPRRVRCWSSAAAWRAGCARTSCSSRRSTSAGDRLAGDVRLLADLATSGAAVAAKDVSMAGLVGSLAMLLEPNRLGVVVDLGRAARARRGRRSRTGWAASRASRSC